MPIEVIKKDMIIQRYSWIHVFIQSSHMIHWSIGAFPLNSSTAGAWYSTLLAIKLCDKLGVRSVLSSNLLKTTVVCPRGLLHLRHPGRLGVELQHDGTWEGYSNQQKQSCLEMANGGIIHNNSKIQTNMNEIVLHTSLWPLVHAAVCDILKFYPRIFRQNSKWDWIFTVEVGDVELNHSLTSYLKSAQKTRHNKTQ